MQRYRVKYVLVQQNTSVVVKNVEYSSTYGAIALQYYEFNLFPLLKSQLYYFIGTATRFKRNSYEYVARKGLSTYEVRSCL